MHTPESASSERPNYRAVPRLGARPRTHRRWGKLGVNCCKQAIGRCVHSNQAMSLQPANDRRLRPKAAHSAPEKSELAVPRLAVAKGWLDCCGKQSRFGWPRPSGRGRRAAPKRPRARGFGFPYEPIAPLKDWAGPACQRKPRCLATRDATRQDLARSRSARRERRRRHDESRGGNRRNLRKRAQSQTGRNYTHPKNRAGATSTTVLGLSTPAPSRNNNNNPATNRRTRKQGSKNRWGNRDTPGNRTRAASMRRNRAARPGPPGLVARVRPGVRRELEAQSELRVPGRVVPVEFVPKSMTEPLPWTGRPSRWPGKLFWPYRTPH